MEELLGNQGLCHIIDNISRFLDPKSLAQCRKVSHSWKNLIDNDRQWWIFQLEHIHNCEKTFIDCYEKDKPKVRSTIHKRFPEWKVVNEQFSRKQIIPKLKEFVKFMWIYFKNESINYRTNPLYYAIAHADKMFVLTDFS